MYSENETAWHHPRGLGGQSDETQNTKKVKNKI